MNRIAEVLVNRDHFSKEAANSRVEEVRLELYQLLEEGADYDDIEDFMASELGLEMDYIDDVI